MQIQKNVYKFDIFRNENIVCGVSTRSFGSIGDRGIKKKNLKKFCDTLGIGSNSVILPAQTHSSNIHFVDSRSDRKLENTDGLITNKNNLFIGVLTADCLPICFFDKENDLIGVVHAGYKGILRGVIEEMVKRFRELGSNIKNIKVVIGPSIGKCCYDVFYERISKFKKRLNSFLAYEKREGKYYLDLKKIASNILLYSGILEKNLEISPICTKSNLKSFFSARGDAKETFGHFITIIGVRK